MSNIEDTEILNGAKEILEALYNFKDTRIFLFGRSWDLEDRISLMKYDVLSESVLNYIFMDEEGRSTIESGLRQLLAIEDPKGAIEYFLCTQVSSPFDAEKLFRRIGLASGFMMGLRKEGREVGTDLIVFMHDVQKVVLLATLSPGKHMYLSEAFLIYLSYLECTLSHLRNLGFDDPELSGITVPTFGDMADVFTSHGYDVDDYVSMGNEKMDAIARPIYDEFRREIEKDALVSFTEENKKAGRMIPYDAYDYISATAAIRKMNEHMAAGDLEDVLLTPSKVGDFVDAVRSVLILTGKIAGLLNTENASLQRPLLKLALIKDFREFILYLAASDDFYSQKKARAFSEAFGVDMTPEGMRRYVRENHLYTSSFEKNEPLFLDWVLQIDDHIKQGTHSEGVGYGEEIVDLMEKAGELFLAVDGSANEEEEAALTTYISMLRGYLKRE